MQSQFLIWEIYWLFVYALNWILKIFYLCSIIFCPVKIWNVSLEFIFTACTRTFNKEKVFSMILNKYLFCGIIWQISYYIAEYYYVPHSRRMIWVLLCYRSINIGWLFFFFVQVVVIYGQLKRPKSHAFYFPMYPFANFSCNTEIRSITYIP
jgi:hypothetical protein